jgi:hypothetical protein
LGNMMNPQRPTLFFAPSAAKNLIDYKPDKQQQEAMADFSKNPQDYYSVKGVKIALPDGQIMKIYSDTDSSLADLSGLDASQVFNKEYQSYFPSGTIVTATNGSTFEIENNK